jgi:HK97 family phage prohead protease
MPNGKINAALLALSLAHAVTDPGGSGSRGAEGVEPAEAPGSASEPDGLYVSAAIVFDVLDGDRAAAPIATNRFKFVASTEDIDSHGTKLKQNWNLVRYQANNVLQWAHNRSDDRPAIGNVEDLKVKSKQLVGEAVFDTTTEFDREVLTKYQKKVLKGFSVGFRANKYTIEVIDGEEVLVLDELELFEISCCNVPSNPKGLTVDQAKRNADTIGRMMDRARAAQFAERSGAVPFKAHPTSTGSWNAVAAEKRVRAWATVNGTLDFARYAEAFTYADPDKRNDVTGYRFQHSDIVDGKLTMVRAGALDVMRAVTGSGLPESDLAAVKRHVDATLNLFGLKPSWARQATNTTPSKAAPTRTAGVSSTMKNCTIDTARATDKGMTCKVGCPACEEPFDLEVKVAPMSTEKAAEFTALSTDLAARTADLATALKDLAEVRTLKTADESRAAALQSQVTAVTADLNAARADIAARDIDALIGVKIAPTERASQLAIAEMFMAKSDGGAAWKGHLDGLRGRPDMMIVGAPIVGADMNKPTTPGAAPKNTDAARGAFEGSEDAGYSEMLKKHMAERKASVTA